MFSESTGMNACTKAQDILKNKRKDISHLQNSLSFRHNIRYLPAHINLCFRSAKTFGIPCDQIGRKKRRRRKQCKLGNCIMTPPRGNIFPALPELFPRRSWWKKSAPKALYPLIGKEQVYIFARKQSDREWKVRNVPFVDLERAPGCALQALHVGDFVVVNPF